MTHKHSHYHYGTDISGTRLLLTMVLNFIITAVEVAGGIFSGSLALISDALHNFSDGIAIIITYIALKLSKKRNTEHYTFGLKRLEIFAAIINSGVLIVISIYLFKSAFERLLNPTAISGSIMIIVSVVGLLANIIGTLLLRSGAQDNINIRSAYLHLLSDVASSFAVIIGGFFVYFFHFLWIDPLLTFLIAIYVVWEGFKIVAEAINILLMKTPDSISLEQIKTEAEAIKHVRNIHHLHVWRLNDNDIHLEAHIDLDQDLKLSQTNQIDNEIKEFLFNKYKINHLTLQFEYGSCEDVSLINKGGNYYGKKL